MACFASKCSSYLETPLTPTRYSQAGRTHIVKATSVAVANQFVTSGTNFLLGVYLLRELSLAEFGLYGTIFSASMLVAGLVNALILGQMVILYPDYDDIGRLPFLSSIMTIIHGMCGASVAVTAFLLASFGPEPGIFVAPLALAGAFVLKEFYARLAYVLGYEVRALRVNAAMAVALLVSLATLKGLRVELSALSAIGGYIASMFIGAMVGHFDVRLPFVRDKRHLRATFRELWVVGRWALVNEIGYGVRQQGYVLLTAVLVGPVGVGLINAARLLVAPIMMVTPALSQLYIARLVQLRNSQPLQLLRNGIAFSVANGSCVVVYALLLILLFPFLTALMENEALPGLEPFVVAWCVGATLAAMRSGLESTQRALKKFRSLAKANLPVGIVTLIVVTALVLVYGPIGSIYGYCIAELTLLLILAGMVRMERRQLMSGRLGK